ncbi:hypothetical protein PAXRUDRAFT_28918 [Paxillus rubicundulus Ve08.2h10]|uniref:Uncharacterized protein n=1 Tax=Paxillus rubicundulus Ve08.2h10 TaxID=930991 RepID=A0A0D0D8N0_9AGAM|nr:hypothetical protein PAXRUDRAFT_28918 [Paxillus rubicundulus Ve08.2h10]
MAVLLLSSATTVVRPQEGTADRDRESTDLRMMVRKEKNSTRPISTTPFKVGRFAQLFFWDDRGRLEHSDLIPLRREDACETCLSLRTKKSEINVIVSDGVGRGSGDHYEPKLSCHLPRGVSQVLDQMSRYAAMITDEEGIRPSQSSAHSIAAFWPDHQKLIEAQLLRVRKSKSIDESNRISQAHDSGLEGSYYCHSYRRSFGAYSCQWRRVWVYWFVAMAVAHTMDIVKRFEYQVAGVYNSKDPPLRGKVTGAENVGGIRIDVFLKYHTFGIGFAMLACIKLHANMGCRAYSELGRCAHSRHPHLPPPLNGPY